MNPHAVGTLDDQSLHNPLFDPLFIDWLLQNQQQPVSLNQLPGAAKEYPASSFQTTTGTNAYGTGNDLLLNPSSRGVPPPPVENSGFQNLEPKNPQLLLEQYKSELNQKLNPINVNYLNGAIANTAKESERPLDLSCSSNNMGVRKTRNARENDHLQTRIISNQVHQQQPHQKKHSSAIIPLFQGGTETIPLKATKTHFTGMDYTYCLAPAASFPFGYRTPPHHSPLLPATAPVFWVPFAVIGNNQTLLPTPSTVCSNNNTIGRISPDQMMPKMVPVNPSFLCCVQGRSGQSSEGGKWPKNSRPVSPDFCSPSPVVPSTPKKISTLSSSPSSSDSSAFSPPPSTSTSSSILVRRKLRAMLLKNRS